MVAQKPHPHSDIQVQMARELGFKPDSLHKIETLTGTSTDTISPLYTIVVVA